ncbi:AAA family ATPase [Aeromonas dhakensis]|uniref:ATP-dependent nuclease n=1 Tax=Aeromonas dhakensis TaxID=196024 RepID=UPI0021576109|nr:ATP-binding protein [Aeromonas dhakensis]MCR6740730.1 AAA family ATPase [Aeromonas dhakensis]
MKIKEVKINRFKRFTSLSLTGIPESAKLIVLVGPNGCGKTSLFEALNHWYKFKGFNERGMQDYLEKKDGELSAPLAWRQMSQNQVEIFFHNNEQLNQEQIKGKFYFRTAYRNEPDFTVSNLNRQLNPAETIKLQNLMQNDQTVSENYQRLVAQTLAGVYEVSNNTKTVEELRDELIGKIKSSLSMIFEDLNLNSIGDPLSNGSFYFEKGSAKDFHYKNLSAGEKSVFDLVLDMIIKSSFYSDAVFCIDEPEAHMHTRLQSKVLRELYSLTPDNSQLWVSTHSIGMLKEAEEIEERNPGTVVFLDFDNRDFDLTETIQPTQISRAIWDRFFDLAFADFSKLISPQKIVFCEGTSQGRKYKDFDALIYGKILGEKYHGATFVSVGSCSEIEDMENQSVKIVSSILKSSEIIKFVDRDDKSDGEVVELLEKGIRTSRRRHIECYLLDDEIIRKLCTTSGKEDLIEDCLQAKASAIQESVERGNPQDDIKSASGKIFTEIKRVLDLTQCGNNKCAFLRDTIAPLVTEETLVYREIENEIFGTIPKGM